MNGCATISITRARKNAEKRAEREARAAAKARVAALEARLHQLEEKLRRHQGDQPE